MIQPEHETTQLLYQLRITDSGLTESCIIYAFLAQKKSKEIFLNTIWTALASKDNLKILRDFCLRLRFHKDWGVTNYKTLTGLSLRLVSNYIITISTVIHPLSWLYDNNSPFWFACSSCGYFRVFVFINNYCVE